MEKENPADQNDLEASESEEQVEDSHDRRGFLKLTAVAAVSLVAGAAMSGDAEAQEIKADAQLDSPTRATQIQRLIKDKAIPLNNTAVLADGTKLTRAQILEKLNLNPNTPPDAWLAIVACGSNASALNFKDAEQLVNRGVLDKQLLRQIRTATPKQ